MFRPTGWEWNRYVVPMPDLPAALDGLKILHLSDFHCRPNWFPEYDELIDRVNRADADLILFTGDFVEDKVDPRAAYPVVKRLVTPMTSRLGFFSILGNHDIDVLRSVAHEEWGVTPVDQRQLILRDAGNTSIELIGLAGLERTDLDRAFVDSIPPKQPDTLRVVMNHYPDGLRAAWSLAPDLYLSGHTHGGQLCLPNGFPPNKHDTLPARFIRGAHQIGKTWMFTSRGFGFSSALQLRLFCPAEAVELTLRRSTDV